MFSFNLWSSYAQRKHPWLRFGLEMEAKRNLPLAAENDSRTLAFGSQQVNLLTDWSIHVLRLLLLLLKVKLSACLT